MNDFLTNSSNPFLLFLFLHSLDNKSFKKKREKKNYKLVFTAFILLYTLLASKQKTKSFSFLKKYKNWYSYLEFDQG